MPPPTGVVSGPLMPTRNSFIASTVSSGSQLVEFLIDFSPANTSYHTMLPLALIRLLHCSIEHPHRGLPNIASGTVAFYEWNNWVIGDVVAAIVV